MVMIKLVVELWVMVMMRFVVRFMMGWHIFHERQLFLFCGTSETVIIRLWRLAEGFVNRVLMEVIGMNIVIMVELVF